MDKLTQEIEDNNIEIKDIFTSSKGQHPYIIKAYLRKTINIETLVILDKSLNFKDTLNKEINDDILWPDISRLIEKYKPFLKIDTEKYGRIFRTRFGHLCPKDN